MTFEMPGGLRAAIEPLIEYATDPDEQVYSGALTFAHTLVSASGLGSVARFHHHQAVTGKFIDARCAAGLDERVFGFFMPGTCVEASLFGAYPEVGRLRWEVLCGGGDSLPADGIIIGYGLKSQAVTVAAWREFDISQSADFGWTDEGHAPHIEFYDVVSRIYYRQSGTGRTSYQLLVDPKTRIAIPLEDGDSRRLTGHRDDSVGWGYIRPDGSFFTLADLEGDCEIP